MSGAAAAGGRSAEKVDGRSDRGRPGLGRALPDAGGEAAVFQKVGRYLDKLGVKLTRLRQADHISASR